MKHKTYKTNKGFTIIELVVSIFVLSIAVIGVFNAFSVIVVMTADSANRLLASYLAQEGAEVVRNIRDANWMDSLDWQTGLTSFCATATGCQVDYKTNSSSVSPYGVNGSYLNIDTDGFYSYSSINAPTKFKRKIIITCLPDGDCPNNHIMKVSVQVFWDEKPNVLNPTGGLAGEPGSGSVTVEEYFYNWF